MKSLFLILFVLTMFTQCNTAQSVEAELYYIVRQPKVKVANPPLLILLHGLGSNEKDLYGLAPLLPDSFLILSVRAPRTISEGSYRWYDLKFVDGEPVGNVEEQEESRKMIVRFLEQLKNKHIFDRKRVFLCGFSQGAIMSYSVALSKPELLRGIIALGGRMPDGIEEKIVTKKNFDKLEMLIIHGSEDKVLLLEGARNCKKIMEELGIKNEYHELKMGHTINRETLDLINTWLNRSF